MKKKMKLGAVLMLALACYENGTVAGEGTASTDKDAQFCQVVKPVRAHGGYEMVSTDYNVFATHLGFNFYELRVLSPSQEEIWKDVVFFGFGSRVGSYLRGQKGGEKLYLQCNLVQ